MQILLELGALAVLLWVLVTTYRAFVHAARAGSAARSRSPFVIGLILLGTAWIASFGWLALLILDTWKARDLGGWPLLAGPVVTASYWLIAMRGRAKT